MADNKETIICPACGEEMEKIYFPDQKINLDICLKGCGGIFFDNRELEKFDEKHEDISILSDLFENKEFKKVDSSIQRECPVCGMKMVKNYASTKHEVEVDECYSCGGKFLDYGELEKIRSQYNTEEEKASDVIKELYSATGSYLPEFEEKYNQQMKRPSILTKMIRLKRK